MAQDVNDKPAEVSLKLSNILQALVLMVMSWVGFNIQEMGKDIAEIRTELAVGAVERDHIAEEIRHHVEDKYAHNYYIGGGSDED